VVLHFATALALACSPSVRYSPNLAPTRRQRSHLLAAGVAIATGYRDLIENKILPIAYSSLLPLSEWRAVEDEDSAKTDKMKADGASKDSPFKYMAKKYGVSEAQVLLRWGLQKGYPIIPKSTNEDRIRQNINVFSFEIDNEDMEAIANMDRGAGIAWASGDPIQVP
jgi:2,5-diketo-D-gluconate reductase A